MSGSNFEARIGDFAATLTAALDADALAEAVPEMRAQLAELLDMSPAADPAIPTLLLDVAGTLLHLEAAVRGQHADSRWELREQVSRLLDLLEDLTDEVNRGRRFRDPFAAAQESLVALKSLDNDDLGQLFGVERDTIGRWRTGSSASIRGDLALRAGLVSDLVDRLLRAWTPRGVFLWFTRPRVELKGESPLDLLNAVGPTQAETPLQKLARGWNGEFVI